MEIKYHVEIDDLAISDNLKRLVGQTYKLLPSREENLDWQTPLSTIIEECAGIARLITNRTHQSVLFTLLCKLEGLYGLDGEEDFFQYRRIIFECLGLLESLKKLVAEEV